MLMAACSQEEGIVNNGDSQLLSFGINISDDWQEKGTRSISDSDTLFHSVREIPNTDLMLETVTLRGFDAGDKGVAAPGASATRGVQINEINEFWSAFSIFSIAYDKEKDPEKPLLFIDNDHATRRNVIGLMGLNTRPVWMPVNDRYWPDARYNLQFFGVAPCDNGMSDLYVEKDFSDSKPYGHLTLNYSVPYDADNHRDLMVALGRRGDAANADYNFPGDYKNTVEMRFKHLLAAVQVRVVAPDGETKVYGVGFNNVVTNASYDLASLLYDDLAMTHGGDIGQVYKKISDGQLLDTENTNDVATADGTFLMIPQLANGVTFRMNFSETGTPDTSTTKVDCELTEGFWEAGTTTLYTVYPRSVKLKIPCNNYEETKTTYSLKKNFIVDQELPAEYVPAWDIPPTGERDYYYTLAGWTTSPNVTSGDSKKGLPNVDNLIRTSPGYVEPGGVCSVETETTLYPLIRFPEMSGMSVKFQGPSGEWDRSRDHYVHSGFVNEYDIEIPHPGTNAAFFKRCLIDGVEYYYGDFYTLKTMWKNAYAIIEDKKFEIYYDTTDIGIEMPEEAKAGYTGDKPTMNFYYFDVSPWKKGEIEWTYMHKDGKTLKVVQPGGNFGLQTLDTDYVVLKARWK